MSASNINHDANDLDRIHSAVRREKLDLPAGNEAAPMWAIFIGMIVAVLAGSHLGMMSNLFSIESKATFAPVGDPRPTGGDAGAQLDPFALAMKKGANAYAVCAGCHQGTGMGVPGQFPPLSGSEFAQGGTERLIRIALNGLQGPVTVKGLGFNTPGGMPPQGMALGDQDIANALTYVRNSFGNTGTMVTKDMVAKVRAAAAAHTAQWTAPELEEFSKKDAPGDIPAGPGATTAPAAK
ncbi:MAG: cycA 2 [Verrucomicrobiaceae bacterium]|nr:cycA 2 [Verrucomicrobiaceae bacterium]